MKQQDYKSTKSKFKLASFYVNISLIQIMRKLRPIFTKPESATYLGVV